MRCYINLIAQNNMLIIFEPIATKFCTAAAPNVQIVVCRLRSLVDGVVTTIVLNFAKRLIGHCTSAFAFQCREYLSGKISND